jgi:AmmeMemoRadiSam system protein A
MRAISPSPAPSPTPSPRLTETQGETLLAVAADAIAAVLMTGSRQITDVSRHDAELRAPGATFVTLQRDEQLLGCIGTLDPVRSLVADVAHNAVAAAFADPRMPPVDHVDFEVMSIEISLLSDRERLPVTSYEELAGALRVGTDGLVVEAPGGRATFLPAVWRHFDDDVDAFLGALWRKAGLPARAWCGRTRCERYTTEKLVDPGPRSRPTTGEHIGLQ